MPIPSFVVFARIVEKKTGRRFRDVAGPDFNHREYLDGTDPVEAANAFLVDEGYVIPVPSYLRQVMSEAVC